MHPLTLCLWVHWHPRHPVSRRLWYLDNYDILRETDETRKQKASNVRLLTVHKYLLLKIKCCSSDAHTHTYTHTAAKVMRYIHCSEVTITITKADSVYCDRCYRSLVCRLYVRMSHSCTLLKPLDGMRCHLADTLMWSQVTLRYTGGPGQPTGRGELGVGIPSSLRYRMSPPGFCCCCYYYYYY